ncbi:hypothetical protein [Xanthobacter sediminis]
MDGIAIPLQLSGVQKKNADRQAGLELILPWPKDLRQPTGLKEDEEEDGSDEAWEVARRIIGITRRDDPFLIRGVRAAMLRRQSNMAVRPDALELHLIIEIVSPRFYGAHGLRPMQSWVGPSK